MTGFAAVISLMLLSCCCLQWTEISENSSNNNLEKTSVSSRFCCHFPPLDCVWDEQYKFLIPSRLLTPILTNIHLNIKQNKTEQKRNEEGEGEREHRQERGGGEYHYTSKTVAWNMWDVFYLCFIWIKSLEKKTLKEDISGC